MADEPHRLPRACGAFGRFDRGRVLAIGSALGDEMRVVHESSGAILLMDREPLRWRGDGSEGMAWAGPGHEGARTPRTWRDAACVWDANGIVVEKDRTLLFTSVSGVAAVYGQAEPEATYFATAIDPLVQASKRLLTIDWEGWGAILSLHYPIGGLTPFKEISRLAPFTNLSHGEAGSRVDEQSWPWEEVRPEMHAAEAAPLVVAALREEFSRLGDGTVRCPVSGGYDSRILLSLLSELHDRERISACTVPEETKMELLERTVKGVCEMLGIEHEMIPAQASHYWDDQNARYIECDFQRVQHPWLSPILMRHLTGGEGTVIDGLGGNVQFQPGAGYFSRYSHEAEGKAWRGLFFSRLTRRGPQKTLRVGAWRPLRASTRRGWLEIADSYLEHPNAGSLTFYRTRTIRAIALRPYNSLGSIAPVATPIVRDAVVRHTLGTKIEEKFEDGLYKEVFKLIDPRLLDLGSTNSRERVYNPNRLRYSPEVLAGYHDLVADGPLTPYLAKSVRGWLKGDDFVKPAEEIYGWRSGIEGIAMLHAWHRRYREKLNEIDVAGDLGITKGAKAKRGEPAEAG